jgi:uncharacterized glyoxalase superfamily protein PhnB
MPQASKAARSISLCPTMRYEKCNEAVNFLCEAFGFTKGRVFLDDAGNIQHAELKLGNGVIMVSPNHPSEFGKYLKIPSDVGGVETQMTFISVENIEEYYASAKKHGAEILMPLTRQEYGASDFVCRDPFGHIWSFGNYVIE